MSDSNGSVVLAIGSNRYPYHRFEDVRDILQEFLEAKNDVTISLTTDRDELRWGNLQEYDVLLDYTTSGDLTDEQFDGLHRFVEGGGGYFVLHGASAVYYDTENPREEFEYLIGGHFIDHPDFGEVTVEIVDHNHPITAGVADYEILDEPYELSVHDDVRVLARTTHEEFGEMPVMWTKSYGDGKVFYFSNGHDEKAFTHETFQEIVSRGIAWTSS